MKKKLQTKYQKMKIWNRIKTERIFLGESFRFTTTHAMDVTTIVVYEHGVLTAIVINVFVETVSY